LQGSKLLTLPEDPASRPDPAYLEWHQNNRFLG
jgi:hypothetical protein